MTGSDPASRQPAGAPMHVHQSNRMEALVAILADEVARPGPDADPLVPETIAVQGRGMERWLSIELSQRLGVWANAWFPFPRRLIERAFDSVLGASGVEAALFEPDALRWSIAALMPELIEREEFAPLARSLASDDSSLRRLQLAGRIAEVFDRYVTYRPEMIRRWTAVRATARPRGRSSSGASSWHDTGRTTWPRAPRPSSRRWTTPICRFCLRGSTCSA